MSSRKKVINALNNVERRLLQNQADVEAHKQYWMTLINENKILIGVAMAPIVFIALRAGGRKANLKQVRHYSRLLIVSIITSVQARVLTSLTKKTL